MVGTRTALKADKRDAVQEIINISNSRVINVKDTIILIQNIPFLPKGFMKVFQTVT